MCIKKLKLNGPANKKQVKMRQTWNLFHINSQLKANEAGLLNPKLTAAADKRVDESIIFVRIGRLLNHSCGVSPWPTLPILGRIKNMSWYKRVWECNGLATLFITMLHNRKLDIRFADDDDSDDIKNIVNTLLLCRWACLMYFRCQVNLVFKCEQDGITES